MTRQGLGFVFYLDGRVALTDPEQWAARPPTPFREASKCSPKCYLTAAGQRVHVRPGCRA